MVNLYFCFCWFWVIICPAIRYATILLKARHETSLENWWMQPSAECGKDPSTGFIGVYFFNHLPCSFCWCPALSTLLRWVLIRKIYYLVLVWGAFSRGPIAIVSLICLWYMQIPRSVLVCLVRAHTSIALKLWWVQSAYGTCRYLGLFWSVWYVHLPEQT